MTSPLKRAAAGVAAAFRVLGIDLHPKVAAGGAGALASAAILAGLEAANIPVGTGVGQLVEAVGILAAAFLHPRDITE